MNIKSLKTSEIRTFIPQYMKFVDHLRFDCNEIYFEYGPDIFKKLEKQLIYQITSPLHAIYVARVNDNFAGFIAGDVRPSFFPHSSLGLNAYISAVYINEKYRNSGLALKLIETITEKLFKKHNVEFIELHCLTNNLEAKRIWEKLGYKTFREQMRKKIVY